MPILVDERDLEAIRAAVINCPHAQSGARRVALAKLDRILGYSKPEE